MEFAALLQADDDVGINVYVGHRVHLILVQLLDSGLGALAWIGGCALGLSRPATEISGSIGTLLLSKNVLQVLRGLILGISHFL